MNDSIKRLNRGKNPYGKPAAGQRALLGQAIKVFQVQLDRCLKLLTCYATAIGHDSGIGQCSPDCYSNVQQEPE